MAVARTRSRSEPCNGTRRQYNASGAVINTTNRRSTAFLETCDDVVGNRDGVNALRLIKNESKGSICTGKQYSPTAGGGRRLVYDYDNYPTESHNTFLSNSFPSLPSFDQGRLLSQTGPLTPKVNLPLFIFELRDLPRMIKHAGDLLHKIKRKGLSGLASDREAASATLAYQFGWKPIVDDLSKMLKFVDAVDSVQRNLMKAQSHRGVRRKITIDDSTVTSTQMRTWTSNTLVVGRSEITVTSKRKCWETVRWKLRDGQIPVLPGNKSQAMRIALGLNKGQIPISIWKAIPWTWLLDWFSGISNALQANYNMLYYEPSRACRMTSITHMWSHPEINISTDTKEGSITAGEFKRTEKWRVPIQLSGSNMPRMKLPFLDNFKLSILGSLTILRIRGR